MEIYRKYFSGFTIYTKTRCIEFVFFLKFLPITIAIYKRNNIELIKRFEINQKLYNFIKTI